MSGPWEVLAMRPGGSVTCLLTAGSVVLAATPAGLRRSTNGGLAWSVYGCAVAPAPEVVASPGSAADALLLAGTADGLIRSEDGGESWQPVLVGSRVLSIALSPAFHRDGVVLAGTEQDGLLRSTDRGRTWTSGNPGLLDLTVLGLACSPSFDVDQTAFAGTGSGLFRSRNGGRAWRAVESLPGEPSVQSLALSPHFPSQSVVLAGTEADGLLRSPDGGTSWRAVESLAGRSVTALAWSTDSRVVAGTDAGVMVSTDAGAGWAQVGKEIGPVLSVAFAPDGALLAGVPRGGVVRSRDLSTWETASAGLQANLVVSMALSYAFDRDRTVYLAGLEDGVAVSSDAGVTWESANGGFGTATAVLDLAASSEGVYAATSEGVFHRRGLADDWQQVQPVPARAVLAVGTRVVALPMLPGALAVSSDAGAAWQTLEWPASAGQATSVALDGASSLLVGSALPATSEIAVWHFAGGQGWQRVLVEHARDTAGSTVPLTRGADGTIFVGLGDAVVRSAPGMVEQPGRSGWVWHRAGLPARVTSIEVSPGFAQDGTVLAGTTAGVCISRDRGLTFQPWDLGMRSLPIVALACSPAYSADRLAYAVELGGRIWRRQDA